MKTFMLVAMMLHTPGSADYRAPDHLFIQKGFSSHADCMVGGKQWLDRLRVLYGTPYYACGEN